MPRSNTLTFCVCQSTEHKHDQAKSQSRPTRKVWVTLQESSGEFEALAGSGAH